MAAIAVNETVCSLSEKPFKKTGTSSDWPTGNKTTWFPKGLAILFARFILVFRDSCVFKFSPIVIGLFDKNWFNKIFQMTDGLYIFFAI